MAIVTTRINCRINHIEASRYRDKYRQPLLIVLSISQYRQLARDEEFDILDEGRDAERCAGLGR